MYAIATRLTRPDSQADARNDARGVLLFAVSLSINLAKIPRAEASVCTRISDLASARARWAAIRGWMLLIGATLEELWRPTLCKHYNRALAPSALSYVEWSDLATSRLRCLRRRGAANELP
jgi:hypothetical protein